MLLWEIQRGKGARLKKYKINCERVGKRVFDAQISWIYPSFHIYVPEGMENFQSEVENSVLLFRRWNTSLKSEIFITFLLPFSFIFPVAKTATSNPLFTPSSHTRTWKRCARLVLSDRFLNFFPFVWNRLISSSFLLLLLLLNEMRPIRERQRQEKGCLIWMN